MIAAIYARKSTDQNLPDEAKAVTRQAERARAPKPRAMAGPSPTPTSTPTTGSPARSS